MYHVTVLRKHVTWYICLNGHVASIPKKRTSCVGKKMLTYFLHKDHQDVVYFFFPCRVIVVIVIIFVSIVTKQKVRDRFVARVVNKNRRSRCFAREQVRQVSDIVYATMRRKMLLIAIIPTEKLRTTRLYNETLRAKAAQKERKKDFFLRRFFVLAFFRFSSESSNVWLCLLNFSFAL